MIRVRLLASIALALLATPALPALPPIAPEDLLSGADVVVSGMVEAHTTVDQPAVNGFADRIHVLAVRVEATEKGTVPSVILVKGWTILSRPAGWAGPAGVHGLAEVRQGQHVHLYLKKGSASSLDLIEPNGLDP